MMGLEDEFLQLLYWGPDLGKTSDPPTNVVHLFHFSVNCRIKILPTHHAYVEKQNKNEKETNIAISPCQCEPMEVEGAVGGCGTANN